MDVNETIGYNEAALTMMQSLAVSFRSLYIYFLRRFVYIKGPSQSARPPLGLRLKASTLNITQEHHARKSLRACFDGVASHEQVFNTDVGISTVDYVGTVIPEEGPDSPLRTQISGIFNDAQRTTAGHRKLVVGLRKIQENCMNEPSNGKQERENWGEDDFNAELARCVLRLLGVKKSESAGDRIVRFIGFFLRHASEKGTRRLLIMWEEADNGRCCTYPGI